MPEPTRPGSGPPRGTAPPGLRSSHLTERAAANLYRAVVRLLGMTGFYYERNQRYGAMIGQQIGAALGVEDVVLDLGCGPGGITAKLGGRYRVVGIDLDRHLLERFDNPAIPRVQGRAEQLPVKTGGAKAVLSVSLVEHLRDRVRFFHEIVRVLSPGGRCYLQIPELRFMFEPHTKWPLLFAMKPSFQAAVLRGTGYGDVDMSASVEEARRDAEAAGLRVERVTPLWQFKVARLVGRPMGYFLVLAKAAT